MGKIVEYTLVAADGVFEGGPELGFMSYRTEAYIADGLGRLTSCRAALFGRATYETFSKMWPGRTHPWTERLNAMPKYVFSSSKPATDWANTTLVEGDAMDAVKALKAQAGDLITFGHGRFGEALLREGLTDVIDLSIHPLLAGRGKSFFRDGQEGKLNLAGVKVFSQIVKLTYETQQR